ncbi:MAG: hypothetical protein DRP45_10255 [Candidatus Zixiibacteriota bacterium]|nr:MAG: hypothetical protein DRP45_10255 [candidate division Zixibacteria bacterium]
MSDTNQPTRFWQKIGLIAEISTLCRQPKSDGSTYRQVLELIRMIIPYDAATLYLRRTDSQELEPHACLLGSVPLPGFFAHHGGRQLRCWESRKQCPILWSRSEKDTDFDPNSDFAVIMSAPLLVDDDVIGVLNLGSYVIGAMGDKHLKLVSVIADQFAVSIERSSYVAAIESKNRAIQEAHAELEAAQEKIIAAEKLAAVKKLAAKINHEINNPLAVIVGNVQCFMLEDSIVDEKMRLRLNRIEQSALRISKVNRKLLNIDSVASEGCPGSIDEQLNNPEMSPST